MNGLNEEERKIPTMYLSGNRKKYRKSNAG